MVQAFAAQRDPYGSVAAAHTRAMTGDPPTVVEIYDQTDWHRMLGDVYMKAGRLASALEQYRSALSIV